MEPCDRGLRLGIDGFADRLAAAVGNGFRRVSDRGVVMLVLLHQLLRYAVAMAGFLGGFCRSFSRFLHGRGKRGGSWGGSSGGGGSFLRGCRGRLGLTGNTHRDWICSRNCADGHRTLLKLGSENVR